MPVVIGIAASAAVLWSCGEERQSYVPNLINGEVSPTMSTTDVETFISDSGYTKYKIVADIWDMYDDAQEPHWKFPAGLDLEQYNRDMQREGHVTCDSAIYFSRLRLWRLDGHVVMVNTARDSFITSQLYWDQMSSRIYSDSFIHIVRTDRIIEGYGFESNQNMTAYRVTTPTGIIPIERPEPQDTAAQDSVNTQPRTRRPAPTRASQRNTLDEDAMPIIQPNERRIVR